MPYGYSFFTFYGLQIMLGPFISHLLGISLVVVAFLVFVIYLLFDKVNKIYGITKATKIRFKRIFQTFDISAPIVWQSIIGLGSWFPQTCCGNANLTPQMCGSNRLEPPVPAVPLLCSPTPLTQASQFHCMPARRPWNRGEGSNHRR